MKYWILVGLLFGCLSCQSSEFMIDKETVLFNVGMTATRLDDEVVIYRTNMTHDWICVLNTTEFVNGSASDLYAGLKISFSSTRRDEVVCELGFRHYVWLVDSVTIIGPATIEEVQDVGDTQ